jgi:putative ABC transport system permease protein
MIGSFRESLESWMAGQVGGDLYVSPLDDEAVPGSFYESVRSLPGVGGVDPYRNVPAAYAGTTVFVNSVDAAVLGRFTHFAWVKGGPESWEDVRGGDVIVSESFSRRFSVGPGDVLELPGRTGPAALRIAAVFIDYTSDRGIVMMDRATYLRLYGDPTIDSLAVFLDPAAADRPAVIRKIRAAAAAAGLGVVTGAGMHAAILAIFDTTFAVTRAMRLIAIIVAFFGVAGALLTLFLEREKDFGIYRALGFSSGQISAVTLLEGLIIGLLSFLLSLGLGTAMTFILIKVINARSFLWTIGFYPQIRPYLEAALAAIVGSLAAAAYPALRARRTYPQIQIREE